MTRADINQIISRLVDVDNNTDAVETYLASIEERLALTKNNAGGHRRK